jgi:hypothetical protein
MDQVKSAAAAAGLGPVLGEMAAHGSCGREIATLLENRGVDARWVHR